MARIGMAWMGAAAALAMVAGCDDVGDTSDFDRAVDRFDSLNDEANAEDVVAGINLPDSGSAEYEGSMLVDTSGGGSVVPDQLVGDMTLEADFGDGDISGRIDNVLGSDGSEIGGILEIDGGIIDSASGGDDPTLTFALGGNLFTDEERLAVTGAGLGDFVDADGIYPDYVQGTLNGGIVIYTDGSVSGGATFDGRFVGEETD